MAVRRGSGGWGWGRHLDTMYIQHILRPSDLGRWALLGKNKASGLRAFVDDFKSIMAVPTFFWSTAGFTAVTFTSGALAQWAPTCKYSLAGTGDWGLGIGDWRLETGDWRLETG